MLFRRGERAGGDQAGDGVDHQAGAQPAALSFRDAVDHDTELLVRTVAEDLASAPSGIGFVYRALDRASRRAGASDAVLVIDDTPLGRQAFRANRRPAEAPWAKDLVRTGRAGLHLLGGELDSPVVASITNLCNLAVRLDVARHDSMHDPLTGVLNRRSFDDQLDAAAAQSQRYGWSFALVIIDLDNFKQINDRLGHAAGDTVLRAVGTELRNGLRAGDVAARIGGDEFALVLPNADQSLLPSLLARLDQAVKAALPDGWIGISAGLAVAPGDGTDPRTLLRIADQRLYEAKRR